MKPISTPSTQDSYILELFKIILPYKWLILTISLIFILLTQAYLYFKPSVYESYAIIKVKINEDKNLPIKDFLRDTLTHTNTAGIKQEIAILQTYQTNHKALEKVDFKIQYFSKNAYRRIEMYTHIPVSIYKVTMLNAKFINGLITLYPKKDGFTLESKEIQSSKLYHYDETITTPYFTGVVRKNRTFKMPIIFKINGNNRHIYENIIKHSLIISQLDLETNLIRVSFQDTIPERANNYVNALVEAYIERSLKHKSNTNNKILTFLDDQLDATRAKLEKSENELEIFKSKNKSIEPSIKSIDFFKILSEIDLALSEIRLKEKLIQNLITFIKHNKNLDAIAPTLAEFNDTPTLKLIEDIQQLQIKEDELVLEYTDNYPQLIQLRKRMAKNREKIAFNVKNLRSTLKFKHESLVQQKNKYEKTLKNLPKKEKKLIHFQRNYQVNSKMYTYLLEKKSENELIKVASISDYEAIDRAYTPVKPIKPKRLMLVVLAAIVGILFGAFVALIRSSLIDKIQKKQDVELLTRLPIYGNIPLYNNKKNMVSNVETAEAYRQLAINLQFTKKEHEGNIILISSPNQGEGKTTTIANLSAIFRQTKYKSIIVDLDMYNSSLHEHFGMEQHYSGISTYLSGRDNLGSMIYTTSYSNLDIITAGPTPPNPSELLLSSRLEELFKILKSRYDYIFIDTSSFDTAPEILHLMNFSDTNLMVFRENFSKKSSLAYLEKIIQDKQLKNIGLVLQSTPVKPKKIKKLKHPKKVVPVLIEKQEPIKVLS